MSERGAIVTAVVVALAIAVVFAIFVSTIGATLVGGAVGLGIYLAAKPKPGPAARTANGGWVGDGPVTGRSRS